MAGEIKFENVGYTVLEHRTEFCGFIYTYFTELFLHSLQFRITFISNSFS